MPVVQNPSVAAIVDSYRAGSLSRREFFQMLAYVTGSIVLAREVMLAEGFAAEWEAYDWPEPAAQPGQLPVSPKQSIEAGEKRLPPSVSAEWVKYKSGQFDVGGYLARPKAGTSFPTILIIYENRGLTEFVLDMAQRWAGEGLLALAPDFLSRIGGTQKFATTQEATQGIGQLQRAGVMEDLHATVSYLKSRKDVRGDKLGVSGFCWGGGNTLNFVTESKELAFAMPFYGAAPSPDRAVLVGCPVFGVFAENDARVNQALEPFAARMKELGKPFTYKIYPGTQHAFMNFTNPERYNAEQAKAAWADVTAFVRKIVG